MTSVAQDELYVVLPTVIMILIAAQQLKMPISIYSSHRLGVEVVFTKQY